MYRPFNNRENNCYYCKNRYRGDKIYDLVFRNDYIFEPTMITYCPVCGRLLDSKPSSNNEVKRHDIFG